MTVLKLMADMLGGEAEEMIRSTDKCISELRLRCGRPARICYTDGSESACGATDEGELQRIISRLMENSLYACENELKNGYFTTADGARVGICGRIHAGMKSVESIASIGSVCIRIPREMKGCGRELKSLLTANGLKGMLILSPPGLGKTTLLRELVRFVSETGYNVAVADERREIAACREGIPMLDVGCRTDVMDACPKAAAIPMLVRACAPDLIAADEIGSHEDMEAIRDAVRCGVQVLASAHADSLEDAMHRRNIAPLLREGLFRYCAVLGPEPGGIQKVFVYTDEGYVNVEGNPSQHNIAGLCGHRQNGFGYEKEEM